MKKDRHTKTIAVFIGLLFIAFFVTNSNGKGTWFTNQQWAVINTNATPNDYAAVNQGQLKWIAVRAYAAMSNEFGIARDVATNGAPSAAQLIAGFKNSNNYCVVNLGQVKYVAQPFYNWLINEGKTNDYPWTGAAQTNDYGVANIGQVKNVFDFSIP